MRRPFKTKYGTWERRIGYVATQELEDGRELKLTFVDLENSATFDDPAEGERVAQTYYLDGAEYDEWHKLPQDVRDEVDPDILETRAKEDINFDFGDYDGS